MRLHTLTPKSNCGVPTLDDQRAQRHHADTLFAISQECIQEPFERAAVLLLKKRECVPLQSVAFDLHEGEIIVWSGSQVRQSTLARSIIGLSTIDSDRFHNRWQTKRMRPIWTCRGHPVLFSKTPMLPSIPRRRIGRALTIGRCITANARKTHGSARRKCACGRNGIPP